MSEVGDTDRDGSKSEPPSLSEAALWWVSLFRLRCTHYTANLRTFCKTSFCKDVSIGNGGRQDAEMAVLMTGWAIVVVGGGGIGGWRWSRWNGGKEGMNGFFSISIWQGRPAMFYWMYVDLQLPVRVRTAGNQIPGIVRAACS
jgi:hypothetical protein